MGFSAVMVDSGRTSNNLSGNRPIAPVSAVHEQATKKRQSARFCILRDALRWSVPQDEEFLNATNQVPHAEEAPLRDAACGGSSR
jgi:hypothetical protein